MSVRTLTSLGDQGLGDRRPGIAERAGHDIDTGRRPDQQECPELASVVSHLISSGTGFVIRASRSGAMCFALAKSARAGLGVTLEVAQHLQTEIESDDGMGNVTGRQDAGQRGRARGTPRSTTGRMTATAESVRRPQDRGRVSQDVPGDHLDQHGDVSRVQVAPKDRLRHLHELARAGHTRDLCLVAVEALRR